MTEHWEDRSQARRLADIVETQHGKGFSGYVPSLTGTEDEPRKPTRATESVVYSWGIRWTCPRDTHPDTHDMRLRMLMHDCASIPPGDLRKVGDRLATRLKWLPSAAEVHAEYESLLSDRARQEQPSASASEPWGNRPFPTGHFVSRSREHIEWIANVNRYQIYRNAPSRLVLAENAQQSRMVLLSEGWRCNGDGTVSAPIEGTAQ